MSATKTTTELATSVLRELSILGATEAAESEDVTHITDAYVNKHEELADRKLAYWANDEIPPPVFLIIRDLVLNEVRGSYGQPISRSDKEANEITILRKLREHMRLRSSGMATYAEYM